MQKLCVTALAPDQPWNSKIVNPSPSPRLSCAAVETSLPLRSLDQRSLDVNFLMTCVLGLLPSPPLFGVVARSAAPQEFLPDLYKPRWAWCEGLSSKALR